MSETAGTWERSTFCEASACIEVSHLDGDVLVRDGKDVDRPFLRFSLAEWDNFRAAVIAKEFPSD